MNIPPLVQWLARSVYWYPLGPVSSILEEYGMEITESPGFKPRKGGECLFLFFSTLTYLNVRPVQLRQYVG